MNTTEANIWRLLEEVSARLNAVANTQDRIASTQDKMADAQAKSERKLAALDEKNKRKLAALEEKNARELAVERKKTEASRRKVDAAFEELAARIRELSAKIKELAAAHKETEAIVNKLAAEHKKTEAMHQQTELAQQRTEAAQRQTELAQQRTEAAQQRTEARLEEVLKELGGIGQTQGDIAEEFFSHNFTSAMQAAGIRIDQYDTHVLAPPDHEYDIVGVNGDCVVVVEVKSRLKKNHIKDFIQKLPRFVEDFPEYRDKKLYGAVAGMAMREEDGEYAGENGLFLLTQSDSGAAEAQTPGGSTLRDFARP